MPRAVLSMGTKDEQDTELALKIQSNTDAQ